MIDESPNPGTPEQERDPERRAQILETLSIAMAKSRSAAIAGKEASGIEQEWLEDEEFCEGIDDANRGQMSVWRSRLPGQTAILEQATASTIFPNITGPYVDAAAARVSDMMLPTDDRAWAIKSTPIPDLAGMQEGKFPPHILKQAASSFPGQPELAQTALKKAVDIAMQKMDEATAKAEKAQKRIEDWHVECQFHAHVRTVVEDAARIGTGILKGPTPTKTRQVAFIQQALVMQESIKPASTCISAWNLFPDPDCGENIHDGGFIWEKDEITEKKVGELKGTPGYFDDQIDVVLAEGPMKATKKAPERPSPDGQNPEKNGAYEIWYYHGNLKKDELEAIGCKCGDEHIAVPAQVTMVNNHVIKAILNPLDTGDFPYDVMVWRKRARFWAGVGVARQIRAAQKIVIGAVRNMLDNAGRAGGPMLLLLQGKIVPANGVYEVSPWKVWYAGEDMDKGMLEDGFRFLDVPMVTDKLMAIIQFGLKLAEDVTGLPLLMQGQQGSAPDTVGVTQILNNNASTVLRRLARLFDDRVTEPHVRRYYVYLLQYGEDDEKGDFLIDARGSSALVERDIENQTIGEMAGLVLDPRYGKDPKKWMDEFLKSKHLDPKRFDFDDDQWKQIVENLAKQGGDPAMAIAQLRAQVDLKIEEMDQAFKAAEAQKGRQFEASMAMLDKELADATLNESARKTLTEVKARLADTVMKLNTQKQLSREEGARQVLKPPTEPKGRAPNGQAFAR